jgi:hypothetical protein
MSGQLKTAASVIVASVIVTSTLACGGRPVLFEGVRARALASSLHVNFTKAVEASERAVMADTDDASDTAAKEARSASDAALKNAEELKGVLAYIGDSDEVKELEQFAARFDELRKLDDEILPLSVENSNLKAQRLSFGEAQRAADDLTTAVNALAAQDRDADRAVAALRCLNAVLTIQVLQARHIAEASDARMTAIEQQMDQVTATAREQLARLASRAKPGDHDIAAAHVALDLFVDDNRAIVRMSRRNTNVRSLALSLGRKRVIVADCEAHLGAIDAALTTRESKAVR